MRAACVPPSQGSYDLTMLALIDGNGVRVVLVEDQTRFARDLRVYVLGQAHLRARDVGLITADGHELTCETDEMTEAMMAIGAVFAGLERKRLVKKLRSARDRIRQETGRCEGRRPLPPLHERFPDAVAMAKRLRRANPKTGKRRSLRKIADELSRAGHVMAATYRSKVKSPQQRTSRTVGVARPFNVATIRAMLACPTPAAITSA